MAIRTIDSVAYSTRSGIVTQRNGGHATSNAPYVGNLTWQECHDELARPELDSARRAQVELRLADICWGSY